VLHHLREVQEATRHEVGGGLIENLEGERLGGGPSEDRADETVADLVSDHVEVLARSLGRPNSREAVPSPGALACTWG
jgi:hypothetical protein